MEEFEILIPILAILVGGTAVIIPIAGLTARFALKPAVEAFARLKEAQGGSGERVHLLEQRVALLEEQLHAVERENARLGEEMEFHKKLAAPKY